MIDLRAERLNRGLSLDALSVEVEIPKSTLARIEGGTAPRPESAKKLADFYGVKVTDIWPVERAAA